MSNYTKQGWVRLHRKIAENELWFSEPFTRGQAWVDLFLNANHKDNSINIRGNFVAIKRGQIGWSEVTMSKRWTWSKNKVRRFLKYLETKQQIKQQKDRYITTIITICNYDLYQTETADDTAERQQKDSRRYINKNVNNEKNEKKKHLTSIATDVAEPINEFIGLFKEINPSYETLYPNKTQRAASERLLKKHGLEPLRKTLLIIEKTNGMQYAPVITTPIELEKLGGKLKAFVEKEKITMAPKWKVWN